MFNYYLLGTAYNNVGFLCLLNNFRELNKVITLKTAKDNFYYSNNIWSVNIDDNGSKFFDIFKKLPDVQFRRQVLPFLLGKIKIYDRNIRDIEDFNRIFHTDDNAFWGVNFIKQENYTLKSYNDYCIFKKECAKKNIKYNNFDDWYKMLFNKIILCENARKQIKGMLDVENFKHVIENLIYLDDYNNTWNHGAFNIEAARKIVKVRYVI
jgi:hypothetical protein